jgi:PAS domain S-box-containing protein
MARPTQEGASFSDFTRPRRLRRWVVVIGVFAIVANLGVDAYALWRSYRFTLEDNSRELANNARILAAQTEGTLKAVDVLLREAVDGRRRGATAPPADLNALLTTRAQGLPQLLSLAITDTRGNEVYRSGAAVDPTANVADRSDFVAQRDNDRLGLYVSEPIVTRPKGQAAIVLSRRLTDPEGRFVGVVRGVVDLDRFQQFYRQIQLGTRSAILLLRNDGTLLVREPPLPDRVGKPFPTITEGPSTLGATRMTSPIDGVLRFVARAHTDGFPLVVAIAREAAAALDPWREEAVFVVLQDVVISLLIALAIAALVHQLRRVELGERALRESEERYALAMEGANEGHFDRTIPEGGGFLSPRMRELLGLSPGGHTNSRADALVNVHPDDRGGADAAFQAIVDGRTERYDFEYRVRQADGEWHWLHVRGRSLRDAAGKPYRFVGSASDITDRKHAEAEKEHLERQLRKSQKLEAMGTLAGGIAHDFNNILGAILGYGELAQKNAGKGNAVRRYVDNVMQAAGRAKALVEQILAFSRSGLGERAPVNVQAVVAETLQLLAASLPARIQLERNLDSGDAAVIADATQLHQVVMNLCTNAVQAMPAGGVLEVRLVKIQLTARQSAFQGELPPGPYARLTVRDTGTGIEPKVLDRMFDPFFTTKMVGAGTGLGLSLVHGIVVDVGGAIDVASAVDEGTTFTIWLPIAGSAPAPETEVAKRIPHGNGEIIMVVDDERTLVELAEETLAQLGYEPVGFESSKAALQALAKDPHRFDLVLSDEMMPELSGTSLAAEIRRIRSDIPIIIMSGYVDSGVAALASSVGVHEVLRKPLQTRDIAEALVRALPVSSDPTDAAR